MTEIRKLVNLTPHQIRIPLGGGVLIFEESGQCARIATEIEEGPPIMGVPTSLVRHGEITGLPEKEEGVGYIVSQMIALEAKRDDLYYPTELMRDKNGRVTAAAKLARVIREHDKEDA